VKVVAEAGQCHNGSVGKAILLAWHAKQAGASAIKYQLLKPETIAQPDAGLYWKNTLGETNQRDAFTRAGIIDYPAWGEVADACHEYGIEFLATPFDLEAVDKLESIGVRRYKIASGDITYRQLIERVADTGKGIILSTGASMVEEIWRAVGWCGDTEDVTLLACSLSYPCTARDANVSRINRLVYEFGSEVGYSDHTSLPETGLAAAALGSVLNEVHFTLNNAAPDVPDHAMACDPDRLAAYVDASQLGEKLRGEGSLWPMDAELAARVGARRSVCARVDVGPGHVWGVDDFVFLRPGDGVPPFEVDQLVGCAAWRAYEAGEQIVRHTTVPSGCP